MDYQLNDNAGQMHINMSGAFSFSDSTKFHQLLGQLKEGNTLGISIDLSQVTSVDSAALGMLLLLRDEMQKRNVSIALNGAQDQVKKVLMLSKFDKLFTLN